MRLLVWLAALVLWLMGQAGPQWWVWAWLFWVGFTLLMMVVYPTVIAPLFNRFQPLEDASLRERVTALMQRCGFVAKGLFVMDGSRRSQHASEPVDGFLRHRSDPCSVPVAASGFNARWRCRRAEPSPPARCRTASSRGCRAPPRCSMQGALTDR